MVTLFDEYYDYVLGKNRDISLAKRTLFEIVRDLTDRQGLSDEWEGTEEDIINEIMERWLQIIESSGAQ